MGYPYEATAYIEKGWWLVHAVDIGRQARVSTLAEAEDAARDLYARHLGTTIDHIHVMVHVYRATPTAVIRARWNGLTRRRRTGSSSSPPPIVSDGTRSRASLGTGEL